jgi:hypothetical protein
LKVQQLEFQFSTRITLTGRINHTMIMEFYTDENRPTYTNCIVHVFRGDCLPLIDRPRICKIGTKKL